MSNQHTEHKFFDRYCTRCEEKYTPWGKFQKICENCLQKTRKEQAAKQKRRKNG